MQALNLKTNQVEELDSEQLERALLDRTHTVRGSDVFDVLRPDGKVSKIEGRSIFKALEEGYKLPNRDLQAAIVEEDEYGSKDPQAFGLGVFRQLLMGYGDRFLAEVVGFNKDDIEKIRRYNPYSSMAGELTGVIAPAVATGGTGAIARAASLTPVGALTKGTLALENVVGRALLPKATLTAIEAGQAVNPLIKTGAEMTAKAIGTAVEGSAYGASNYISEQYLGDTPFSAEALFSNMREEFVTGGIIGALIPPIAKGASKLAKTVTSFEGPEMQAILGADPMSSRYYLMNPDFFESAKNAEELGDMISLRYDEIKAALDKGEITYKQVDDSIKYAEAEYKDYPNKVKKRIKEIKLKFEEELSKEKRAQENLGIDEGIAAEFQEYKNALKKKIIDGTEESYSLLDEADASGVERLSYKNLLSTLKRYTAPYYKKGSKRGELIGIGEPEKKSLKVVNGIYDDIKRYQETQKKLYGDDLISFSDLKDILKSINSTIEFGTKSQFSLETSDSILKRFGGYINDTLKSRIYYPKVSQDYAIIMNDLYDKTKLLSELNARMGSPLEIMNQLKRAAKGEFANMSDKILELGGHTDTYDRLKSMLDDMSSKNRFVSGKDADLEREILNKLPESREYEVLLNDEKILEKINNIKGSELALRDYLDEIVKSGIDVEKSPALQKLTTKLKLSDERFNILASNTKLGNDLKKMKSVENREDAIKKINSALSKNFNEIKIMFRDIADLTDKELVSMVQQLRVKEAFNKRPNSPGGFRNAGFFSAIGGLLSFPLGTSGPISTLIGIVVGGLVDYHGPKAARSILRRAAKIKGVIEPHHIQKMMMEEFGEGPNKYILEMNSEALKEVGKTRTQQAKRLIEASRSILDPKTIIKIKSITDDDELSYQSSKDNAEKIIANANNLEAGIFKDNEVVSLMMPETYANYVNTYTKMANFLQSKLPVDADNPIDEYVPSRSEEYKFRQYYKYATNPAKALDSIIRGDLSPMAIETLKEVYPTTFNYLNDLVVEQLSEIDLRTIPRSVKQKIKEYFGIDLLPNLNSSLFMKMQAPSGQEEQQMADKPKKIKNYSGQMKTEMNRISNRA